MKSRLAHGALIAKAEALAKKQKEEFEAKLAEEEAEKDKNKT